MLSTLLIVNRLLIGLWPRSITHQLVFISVKTLCIAIPNAQEDESFADDLNKKRGIVSSRVALLLRSTEIQPAVSKIRAPRAPPPPLPLPTSLPFQSTCVVISLDYYHASGGSLIRLLPCKQVTDFRYLY